MTTMVQRSHYCHGCMILQLILLLLRQGKKVRCPKLYKSGHVPCRRPLLNGFGTTFWVTVENLDIIDAFYCIFSQLMEEGCLKCFGYWQLLFV
ncbi:hypothetical protein RJT34_13215 [Clitoria ternatea]|uniref:Uncharacterized protein n=1 Tax=Clitoria ternatea TaxID=43366 RepID=A0AAN9PLI0_CLITE